MNADQVHIAGCRRRGHHDSEKKSNHLSVLFGYEGMFTKLVEEHGICATTSRPTPPLVQHGDDIVVVRFGQSPDLHFRHSGITNSVRTHGERLTSMSEPRESPQHQTLLFCPFCGEAFEGRRECPEHELVLLPIDELPNRGDRSLEEVRFFADPRLGRGPVMLGAVLVLIGFVAPFARSRGIEVSALEAAVDGAINLWLTPGAAILLLSVPWRRRTRSAMRAARAAVFGLAVSGLLPLAYTTRRIEIMAEAFGANVEWLWGPWLMVAGLILCATSSVGFGGRLEADGQAAPDSDGLKM